MNISPNGRVTPTTSRIDWFTPLQGWAWIIYFACVLFGVMGLVHWLLSR